MEPVTHALASLALRRAGIGRVTRWATPMLLVSGLAADLDWLSYFGGPRAFLSAHRTASHSLVGTTAIAAATAAFFCWLVPRWLVPRFAPVTTSGSSSASSLSAARAARLGFWPALGICGAGASVHLLLDLTNSYGVKLFWPFSGAWYAWDLAGSIDPWILFLLIAAVFLPLLFGLVTQEITGRAKQPTGGAGVSVPLVMLLLVFAYLGGRAALHARALALLDSSVYREERPLRSAAFPGWSPFEWSGLVETADAIEQVAVPVYPTNAPGKSPRNVFDPESARHFFKPAESAALESARRSASARQFLSFARFPFATQEETSRGVRVEIHDLRFAGGAATFGPASAASPDVGEVVAVIILDAQSHVIGDELRFAAARERTLSRAP
jgi:inner membrane protein